MAGEKTETMYTAQHGGMPRVGEAGGSLSACKTKLPKKRFRTAPEGTCFWRGTEGAGAALCRDSARRRCLCKRELDAFFGVQHLEEYRYTRLLSALEG